MAEPDDELFLGEWMDGRRSREDLEAQVGAEAAEAYSTILKEVDTWTLPPVDKEAGLDRLRSLRNENPPAGKQVRMTPVRWA
ncbi:MAG TPA: hypothetical protein DCR93_20685, partial [Cytophagales bacterium]|nr:hypothetical protein [Cytophagales bacterium]